MSERLDSPRKCITFDVKVRIYMCKSYGKNMVNATGCLSQFSVKEDKY